MKPTTKGTLSSIAITRPISNLQITARRTQRIKIEADPEDALRAVLSTPRQAKKPRRRAGK